MFNEEGGIDAEEFRTKAVVDRVGTTMTVWMGLTMACAECHDHKYDPFTQEEFYRLYAFFNSVPETGGGTFKTPVPIAKLPPPEELGRQIGSIRAEIASLEAQQSGESETAEALSGWEQRLSKSAADVPWTILEPAEISSTGGATLVRLDDGSIRSEGIRPDKDTYAVIARTSLAGITALRIELLPDDRCRTEVPAGTTTETLS